MPKMTKKEFAARLLFWLFPWPISRALPWSLRIYYFGPGAQPPPGWYYPPGVPGFPWPDPYNPPDPDEWEEPPDGPTNPSDPYLPGPGPGGPTPQPPKGDVFFNDNCWTPRDANTTWVLGHWHSVFPGVGPSTTLEVAGTWYVNYRPSCIHINWSGEDPQDINIALRDSEVMENEIASVNNAEKDIYLPITFLLDDIGSIYIEQTDPGLNPININLIEFF